MNGVFTAKEAEAISMRGALSWFKDTGLRSVDVETDSQLLFKAINGPSFYSVFCLLVDDIKELESQINDVEFSFVK